MPVTLGSAWGTERCLAQGRALPGPLPSGNQARTVLLPCPEPLQGATPTLEPLARQAEISPE